MAGNHFDVLIIGAGLSGVGAACHLSRDCPDRGVALIERRQRMGGTWDLFRYPGIRSDSDMYTLGYNFRPWTDPKVLADGPSIRQYIVDTARQYRIEDKIHYGLRMLGADFSTQTSLWTVQVEREETGERETYTCQFLLCCTGYYNYDEGYKPAFPGEDDFKGRVIHPQHWPEDLDYKGKKVVVIGSGATAVTLVPAMAGEAGHVTMLQRSPTYIATVPERDEISVGLRRFLPEMVVYRMARARNISLQRFIFKLSKQRPGLVRRALLAAARRQLGGEVDMKHFKPSYNPWDERLCAVPNGDLFKVLKKGEASIVTDHIDTFTENGIRLKSGEELDADIIITATGLDLQLLGGAELSVDGQTREPRDVLVYKGVMLRDVPNMAMVFGYTNASWTLKADIAAEYVCRLLNYMSRKGLQQVTPKDHDGSDTDKTFLDLQSGYVQRAAHRLPRQGDKAPWKVLSNYLYDLPRLRYGRLNDDALEFVKAEGGKRRRLGVSRG